MTGWNVTAGDWTADRGDRRPDGDDKADTPSSKTVPLEKSASVAVEFAPHQTTVLDFTLAKAGPPTETRADLGIGPDDIKRTARAISVTVHSLGAQDAPAGKLWIEDAAGKAIAQAATPPLKAPLDLKPKTAVVKLTLPGGRRSQGRCAVRVALLGQRARSPSSTTALALP